MLHQQADVYIYQIIVVIHSQVNLSVFDSSSQPFRLLFSGALPPSTSLICCTGILLKRGTYHGSLPQALVRLTNHVEVLYQCLLQGFHDQQLAQTIAQLPPQNSAYGIYIMTDRLIAQPQAHQVMTATQMYFGGEAERS